MQNRRTVVLDPGDVPAARPVVVAPADQPELFGPGDIRSPDHPAWDKIDAAAARYRHAPLPRVTDAAGTEAAARTAAAVYERFLLAARERVGEQAPVWYGVPVPGTLIERMGRVYGIAVSEEEVPLLLALRQRLCEEIVARGKSPPADMVPLVVQEWLALRAGAEQAAVRLGEPISPGDVLRALSRVNTAPPAAPRGWYIPDLAAVPPGRSVPAPINHFGTS